MTDEYVAVYHFECDASHNSWQAMIARHFEQADEGFELALYKQNSLDDYTTHLDGAAAILLDATEKLHERLGSDKKRRSEAERRVR